MKLLPIFSILLLFWSCSENPRSSSSEISGKQYKLQIYDSVTVDLLGELVLTDYHSTEDMLLGYDIFKKKIEIINKSGQRITSFHRETNDDQGYGIRLGGMGFYKDKQIAILGMKGYYFYDFEGNLLDMKPHPFHNKALPLNFKFDLHPIDIMGDQYIVALTSPDNERTFKDPKYYQEINWCSVTNLTTNTYEAGIPYEQGSPYTDGHAYYFKAPMMEYDNSAQHLVVVFPYNPTLYYYSINGGNKATKLVKTHKINTDIFDNNEYAHLSSVSSKGYGQRQQTLLLSNNYYTGLFLTDSLTLIEYEKRSEVPPESINTKFPSPSEFPHYISVVSNKGRKSQDIRLPEQSERIVFVFDKNEIWLRKNKKNESNYITYFKAKLVPQN